MVVRPQIDRFDQYIPYPQYLKLLLRATDGTTSGMKDFSGYGRVVTNSTGATGSTTQKKLNPYSMYFDGNDDVISVPNSTDFSLGNLWTLSTYIYNTGSDQTMAILQQYVDSSNYFYIDLSSGRLRIITSIGGTAKGGAFVDTTSTPNTWEHWMICQTTTSSFYVYKNGIALSITPWFTGNTGGVSAALSIGVGNNSKLTGYMDHLALWKGVAIPINQLYPQTKPFSFRRA